MFEIHPTGPDFRLVGRFDAAQEEAARQVLERIADSCVLDFGELSYISSAGLGLLVALQQRLTRNGKAVKLANLNPHIRELFSLSGLDSFFEIV